MDLQQRNINFTPYQVKKVRRAIKRGDPIVSVRFKPQDLMGPHPMLFDRYQLKHLAKAQKSGKGCVVEFDTRQFMEGQRRPYEGGQLGAIASILIPIIGSIAAPIISKAIQGAIDKRKAKKEAEGSALYAYGTAPKGGDASGEALRIFGEVPKKGGASKQNLLFPYGVHS